MLYVISDVMLKAVSVDEKNISIARLKQKVAKKFPNSEITKILLSEPDEMANVNEFISKVGTWLILLDTLKNTTEQREYEEAIE